MATDSGLAKAPSTAGQTSPWAAALEKLREWGPVWAEQCVKMTTNPSTVGIQSAKFYEYMARARTNQVIHCLLQPRPWTGSALRATQLLQYEQHIHFAERA